MRVAVSRIDEFMNVLSELVIAKTRLELLAQHGGDHALREVTEQIARLTTSLQDGVMQMRMMPVESLFQRFPRMMRDLQKTLGREFEFVMTGLETEMDRTVMDEMGEALVHLLRNAADHGLEPPEMREQKGKPRKGTIRLSAYASGGHVYLEVADDGAGIDRDRVLGSAVRKGLVDERTASNWTDAQVYDLLFASGFSTAEKVSDISGRGVGLDAVRGKVESLGGDIRVESVPGQGTTFVIELPLTLAILPRCSFDLATMSMQFRLEVWKRWHVWLPETSIRYRNNRFTATAMAWCRLSISATGSSTLHAAGSIRGMRSFAKKENVGLF
ncbi:hypothetical protein GCM10025858_35320 [Alicyclobacillus sacchari]|nr:hypothetical protein GCM10025858_35320 [Alicyclobacillus sacchari]